MLTSDTIPYHLEIVNFLQTLTIKYTPFVDMINEDVVAKGYTVDLTDPKSWKYYVNLQGRYHVSDDVMTVISYDTQEEIPFTQEMLRSHIRTAAAYRPGTDGYKELCRRYPEHRDLIKNILFPVTDVDQAIAAPSFEILGYGVGYLETDELYPILLDLRQTLSFYRYRWYMGFLEYESYFHYISWALLWHMLYISIVYSRVKYIHTSTAHTYHIWTYLTSTGMGDHRDVLNRRQALFLYRNMRYLIANRGKQSNLTHLVNLLLTELNIGLVGRSIYQQTESRKDLYQWTPEFISERIPSEYADILELDPPDSVTQMTYRLVNMGVDVGDDPDDIERKTLEMNATPLNILPTKLVEIQPLPVDQKYADLVHTFVMDLYVRLVISGRYHQVFSFTDDHTGLTCDGLTTHDVLHLVYYCRHRIMGEVPEYLPKYYHPKATFKDGWGDLPKTIDYGGYTYAMSMVFDGGLIKDIRYPLYPIMDGGGFVDLVEEHFGKMLSFMTHQRMNSSHVCQVAYQMVWDHITDDTVMYLTDGRDVSYTTWWASTPGLTAVKNIFDAYEGYDDPVAAYHTFMLGIVEHVIPKDHPFFHRYLRRMNRTETYDRLTAIFIQLCSYHIRFLLSDTTTMTYALMAPIHTLHIARSEQSMTFFGDVVADIQITGHSHDSIMIEAPSYDMTARYTGGYTIHTEVDHDLYTTVQGYTSVEVPRSLQCGRHGTSTASISVPVGTRCAIQAIP